MNKKQVVKDVLFLLGAAFALFLVTVALDVIVGEWAGWALLGVIGAVSLVDIVWSLIRLRQSDAQ